MVQAVYENTFFAFLSAILPRIIGWLYNMIILVVEIVMKGRPNPHWEFVEQYTELKAFFC